MGYAIASEPACPQLSKLWLSAILMLLQGFLASDRPAALELFDKAEEFFKQCKENVSTDTATAVAATAAAAAAAAVHSWFQLCSVHLKPAHALGFSSCSRPCFPALCRIAAA
jgi:hypothetical protein